MNEVTVKLPTHLHKFIVKQEDYTGQDHAVWRYTMRMSLEFLCKITPSSYADGLKKAGVTFDSIPEIEGVNRILKQVGWAAVAVDGFIPPNIFMEFHAYNVLPIVSKIRSIENIHHSLYWDIIHEVLSYVPMLVNPEYAEYLRRFGEIGSKAISTPKDYELFHAFCEYSTLKQNPDVTESSLNDIAEKIKKIKSEIGENSEMSRISNLYWWSTEFGLVGDDKEPKAYGAKLLSLLQENKNYLSNTEKDTYSVKVADVNFDVTKNQQKLFVTPDLAYLNSVLEEFADTMYLRKGGFEGVEKLIESQRLGTIELSSGLQVSGVFSKTIQDDNEKTIYIQTEGETALAYKNKELVGHGIENHKNGFGFPIGRLHGVKLAIEEMSSYDLEAFEIYEGKFIQLDFEGGVRVEGTIISGRRDLRGKVLLISFKDAVVTVRDEVLFQPNDENKGIYHLALGVSIISAYAGAADGNSFADITEVPERNIDYKFLSEDERALGNLYDKARMMRVNNDVTDKGISEIFEELFKNHQDDWLLPLELYEMSKNKDFSVFPFLEKHIEKIRQDANSVTLFDDGKQFLGKEINDYGGDWVYLNFMKSE